MNAPGDIVHGRFKLIERLGSGGMGVVRRARDTVLHREVALKSVRPDLDASGAVRERVIREAGHHHADGHGRTHRVARVHRS
jgi:serine/threonine protein kinase